VGDFELNAEVSPRQVEAGGSISVVATLTGTGRLPEELITPELKGVAWLEPSLEDEIQVDHQGTLGGQRVFTYLVRLDTVGQVDLGTLSLPHYSPRSRRYHVARARLGTVQVIAGPGPVDASEAQSPGSVKLSAELDPRRAPRGTARASWLAADRPWFFPGLLALPSLVLLVRASKAAVANARRLGESRRASPSTLAKKALADANRQFRQGEAASGLASVERALFLSLEAATGIRGRAVLRSELADALARAGLDPELAECVVALLKRTEQVRFAGANAAFDQLMGEAARCVRRILSSRSPTEVRAG
jgi:hypothetical protein